MPLYHDKSPKISYTDKQRRGTRYVATTWSEVLGTIGMHAYLCACVYFLLLWLVSYRKHRKGGRVYLDLQFKEGYNLSWKRRHSSRHMRWLIRLHYVPEAESRQEMDLRVYIYHRTSKTLLLWPSVFICNRSAVPGFKYPFFKAGFLSLMSPLRNTLSLPHP